MVNAIAIPTAPSSVPGATENPGAANGNAEGQLFAELFGAALGSSQQGRIVVPDFEPAKQPGAKAGEGSTDGTTPAQAVQAGVGLVEALWPGFMQAQGASAGSGAAQSPMGQAAERPANASLVGLLPVASDGGTGLTVVPPTGLSGAASAGVTTAKANGGEQPGQAEALLQAGSATGGAVAPSQPAEADGEPARPAQTSKAGRRTPDRAPSQPELMPAGARPSSEGDLLRAKLTGSQTADASQPRLAVEQVTPAPRAEQPDTGGTATTQGDSSAAVAATAGRAGVEHAARNETAAPASAPTDKPGTELYHRIMDQVAGEVRLRHFPDRSDLTVKLNPPELGALRLQVTTDGHAVTTEIQATSDQVRSLLQAHLPMLAEALADAGVRMDSVTVTSGASFNAFMSDMSGGRQDNANASHGNSSGTHGESPAPGLAELASGLSPAGGSSGYDWLA